MKKLSNTEFELNHGTVQYIIYIRKSFYKSLLNFTYYCSRAQFAINKKQKYFWLIDTKVPENLILVFDFSGNTKRMRQNF